MARFTNVVKTITTHKTLALVIATAVGTSAYSHRPTPLIDGIMSELASIAGKSENDDISGEYTCTGIRKLRFLIKESSNLAFNENVRITNQSDGNILLEALGGTSEVPKDFPVNVSPNLDYENMEVSLSGSGFSWFRVGYTIRYGSGNVVNGTLSITSYKSLYGIASVTSSYECTPKEKLKIDAPTIKAVFIRPCLSDQDVSSPNFRSGLYKSFPTTKNDKPVTMVADGTLAGTCKDLNTRGVTDIFIPFKVDDEAHSRCGSEGELLYASTLHPDRISSSFKAAQAVGFDPIKALMNACSNVYKKTSKSIQFHAWMPIFKDPKVIEDLNKQGIEARQYAKPFGLDFLPLVYYSALAVNPELPDVRKYAIGLLEEILASYPVQGVNLDYLRYTDEAAPWGYSWVENASAISGFVQQARDRILAVNSKVSISGDIWPRKSDRTKLGQDLDLIAPYLDVIMPMEYSQFMVKDSDEIQSTLKEMQASQQSKKFVPILRGWKIGGTPIDDDLNADIKAINGVHIADYSIFTYESFVLKK